MRISWIFRRRDVFLRPLWGYRWGVGRLSDEPERAILEGEVTYDGKPVAHGEIRFIPTRGTKGACLHCGNHRRQVSNPSKGRRSRGNPQG